MAQQTALEWLMDKSLKHTYILNTEYIKDKRIMIGLDEFINLFEQSKQMEKEQIINAHTRAYLIGEDTISIEDANNASEQYYNETYNK